MWHYFFLEEDWELPKTKNGIGWRSGEYGKELKNKHWKYYMPLPYESISNSWGTNMLSALCPFWEKKTFEN